MSVRQLGYTMQEVLALLIWTEFYKKMPCRLIISLKKKDPDYLLDDGNVPYWPPLLAEPHVVQYATNILIMRQNLNKYRPLKETDYRVLLVESQEALERLIMEVLTQLYVWCLKGKCQKCAAVFKAQFFRKKVIESYCYSHLARIVINSQLL
jgi:hypothetical protein